MSFFSPDQSPRIVRAAHMPDEAPLFPVVIVGAGACGLTAAIRLREAGVDCLLLERDSVPSGSTALSSGFIPAAETRLQCELGIADSLQQFAEDVVAKTQGQAATHLVEAYTRGVAQAIDALEKQGIVFEILDGFLYPGHRARRMHAVAERTGAALMACLERTASALGLMCSRSRWCESCGWTRMSVCSGSDMHRQMEHWPMLPVKSSSWPAMASAAIQTW